MTKTLITFIFICGSGFWPQMASNNVPEHSQLSTVGNTPSILGAKANDSWNIQQHPQNSHPTTCDHSPSNVKSFATDKPYSLIMGINSLFSLNQAMNLESWVLSSFSFHFIPQFSFVQECHQTLVSKLCSRLMRMTHGVACEEEAQL